MRQGGAPGGGLFVPESLPRVSAGDFSPDLSLSGLARQLLEPFFAGDALEPHLPQLCDGAFDFPVPLTIPDPARPSLRARA